MGPNEFIIFIAVLILLLLSGTILILFLLFNRRKNQLYAEQIKLKAVFNQELTNAKVEIREETLKNISWELHDNIGQLITLAKIQIQQIPSNPQKVESITEIISKALSELRSLSKMINPEVIKNLNLTKAIHQEVERYNRLNYINAAFNITGQEYPLNSKKEIILFRILQEFFINTLKHAQATQINIHLTYSETNLSIIVNDNGKGFNLEEENEGIGLLNMKNRADLINAEFALTSTKTQGTTLVLNLFK